MAPKYIKRKKCEVYSSVVGYIRPVNQWHEGKQAEYYDRKEFDKQLEETTL
jgi:ribonucleoside-triphosphate reductase